MDLANKRPRIRATLRYAASSRDETALRSRDVTNVTWGESERFMTKIIKPRSGQTWAYRNGRHDTITRVHRGAVGSWRLVNERLVPLGRATAMWVSWRSGFSPVTVTELWETWTFVS